MKESKHKLIRSLWRIFNFPIHKGIGRTLLIFFIGISLIPLSVVSIVNYRSAYDTLYQNTITSLSTTSRLKKKFIQEYFADRMNDLHLQANLYGTKKFLSQLTNSYGESGMDLDKFIWSSKWEAMAREHGADMLISQLARGYDDVILIDNKGNILFTVMGEKDLGTNIFFGKYAGSHFGAASRTAFEKGKPVYSDLEFYGPSANELASFIVQPVNDEYGNRLGLLAFRIPVATINRLLQDRTGLGRTGDIFLVGTDLKMRSGSKFSGTSKVLRAKAESAVTRQWLEAIRAREASLFTPGTGSGRRSASGKQAKLDRGRGQTFSTSMIYKNSLGIEVLGMYEELAIGDVNLALVTEIGVEEAFGPAFGMRRVAIFLMIITGFFVSLISVAVTRRIVTPIIRLSGWAKKVSVGDLSLEEIRAQRNEIGELNDSFKGVVRSFQTVTDICQSISTGDFSKSVEVRSSKDLLGESVNRMSEKLRGVVRQANLIAEGDYSTKIIPDSEKDELANALIHMTETLGRVTAENERENWIRSGKNELADAMRGEQDIETLCGNIIGFLARYLDAQVGAIYLFDGEEDLKLAGSYAYPKEISRSRRHKIGHGLVGQAALEKKKAILTDVPREYVTIESGIAEGPPKCLLIVPFLLEGEVKGVLEIGSVRAFTEIQLEFLDQVLDNISIHVNSMESRHRMNRLLEEYQSQSERLQVQQEELRQINEELEEQTKALMESETQLQNQQEELQQINEELEERTQALERQRDEIREKNVEMEMANKVIQEKAKELELANRYKSEFLANMSHELRTPLNSIIVLSQLLCEKNAANLNEKQIEFGRTIHSSANDLLSLINEILDLSKVEAGKMEIHVEDMSLADFANSIERMFRPVAERKNLLFTISVDEAIPGVLRTDRQRTEQIVKNLISNAFKFTSEGGVTLLAHRPSEEIDLSRSGLDHKDSVALSVIDTGAGISRDKQKVIFEAFKQADGTTSRKYGGTGLGLTICQEFARLIGGEIFLKSAEGRGSTFTLIIPEMLDVQAEEDGGDPSGAHIDRSDLPADGAGQEKPMAAHSPDEILSPKDQSILVIEDDAKFASLLSDLAREKGFNCLVAKDGENGLQLAQHYKPDAIMLDIGLPGIDGFSVMQKLKGNPDTSHIPVHIVSGADRQLDAMRMGAIGFLLKPVTIEKLTDAFKKIEKFIAKPVNNFLAAVSDERMRKALTDMAGNGGITVRCVSTGDEAYNYVKANGCDCVILDLDVAHMPGIELLSRVQEDETLSNVPFIVYAERELSLEEEKALNGLMDKMPIQWANSPERMLDEATLFLHRVRKEISPKEEGVLKMVHDRKGVLREKKILLVDDDMRNVFALSSVLEEFELKILVGRNGREGLERLAENPDADLVLMDIMMPEMDGFQAIREIRKQKQYENLPIIALTAKAMKGDRQKCIEAGANDYLSKPVDIDKLITLIRVYLYQ